MAAPSAPSTSIAATPAAGTSADDASPLPIPDLLQQQRRFVLSQPHLEHLHDQAAKELLAGVEKDEMGPYLSSLLADPALSPTFKSLVPSSLLSSLQATNTSTLADLSTKLADADKNLGETEVSDALRAKAVYLARIGEHEPAVEAYELAFQKQAGLGSKIDLRLGSLRLAFFFADHTLIRDQIAKAKELVDSGGDWDRRNRLKVYQGMYLLSVRDFKEGSQLLLDTLSTFTATELLSYDDFVVLTIIGSALALERKDLKKKIIESPEVAQVLPERPHLLPLCQSLHSTSYALFFSSLAQVEQLYLVTSRVLAPHARFYVREMRIKAYGQMLESYRSVTLASMASAFGVSEDFIDAELSRFIAAGRLNCSIDKVNGIIETNRPDSKNAMYASVVRNGDALLNSLSRVSRLVA